MKLHISYGNEKIGKCLNVSQLPGRDCARDVPCFKDCYAMRLANFRPNVYKNWSENGDLWRTDKYCWLVDITAALKAWEKKGNVWVRWWVAGDFIDQDQLNVVIDIAKDFPKLRFMSYTKRFDLDFTEPRPSNLMIRWSSWPRWGQKKPKGLLFETTMVPKGQVKPDNFIECPGSCEACGHLCWDGFNIAINKH